MELYELIVIYIITGFLALELSVAGSEHFHVFDRDTEDAGDVVALIIVHITWPIWAAGLLYGRIEMSDF